MNHAGRPDALHTIHEAIIRAGCFCGTRPAICASAPSRAEGEAVIIAMSKAEPGAILGLSEKQENGSGFIVAWFKNGEEV